MLRSIQSINRTFVENVFHKTKSDIGKGSNQFVGKTLVNALFEPHSKHSIIFDSTMYKMGGKVTTFNQYNSSRKNKVFANTIKQMESYGDIMYLQHSKKDHIEYVKETSTIPVISNEDTQYIQSLTELYSIYSYFTHLKYLKILFVGDIKSSQRIVSLISLITLFCTNKIFFLPYDNHEPDYNFLYDIALNNGQCPADMVIYPLDLNISDYDVVYYVPSDSNTTTNSCINKDLFESVRKDSVLIQPETDKNNLINHEEDIKSAILHELLVNRVN